MYLEHTPIETHCLDGRHVFVKRDDLFGIAPMPPLGKLRGLRRILDGLHANGARLVGCWDTRVSKLGLGVAIACRMLPAMRCVLAYPEKPGDGPPPALAQAADFGATLLPLKPNVVDVCFGQARRETLARGGTMLPFGLDTEMSVEAIAEEAKMLPPGVIDDAVVVVSCGSGVTMSGLIRGLQDRPRSYIGVSSGRSVARITRCLRGHDALSPRLEIVPPQSDYGTPASVRSPFPAHPHYDLKAWDYLRANLHRFPEKIVFWNVGA